MRRPPRGKPTAIFPRILSPREYSPRRFAWQPLPPTGAAARPACLESAAVPVALAPLLQGVAAKREHASTVLDKSRLAVPT